MCKLCTLTYSAAAIGIAVSTAAAPLSNDTSSSFTSQSEQLQTLPVTLDQIRKPKIKDPAWLAKQKADEAAAKQAAAQVARAASGGRVVTYDVITRGAISANVSEFQAQANATLNDGRGWARLGVSFQEVSSGGQFTLVLSEASQMTTFSANGCDTTYSCQVGRYVIVNEDRWLGATPSWNGAGGSLRDYRHMVVNHETGHWLGHGHTSCGGTGQSAAVMQQQSISLQGCSFNPWPLEHELWSTRLGI